MKRILILAAAALLCIPMSADEGMWIPALISQRIGDMQTKGFKLSAEDIYSVNQASLKDAVVLFGSGCTGEIVSAEGLLFTNHHCGYSQIQRHSSIEHDYLKDGFWAMDRSKELPCPGMTVSFLERMEDVTSFILKGCDDKMDETERQKLVKERSEELVANAKAEGKGFSAKVEALYYGNTYYLYVYRVYSDIRFVGAPPSSIGKFGGDTDNWMWPRHTGDFSIFRIYADKDNNPADYSEDNVPYKSKKFFKISRSGLNEGDFTFIYGYPGRTQEYIISEQARWIGEVSDPHKIAIRDVKLAIQKKYMQESQETRIKYSSKSATLANAWKKWQGESLGIKRMKAVENKREYESAFRRWSAGTDYENVLDDLDSLFKLMEPLDFDIAYYTEAAYPVEIARFAQSMASAVMQPREKWTGSAEGFFKNWHLQIDKESFIAAMTLFDANVPEADKPAFYLESMSKYGSITAWAEDIFSNSLFADKEAVLALTADDEAKIKSDPAYMFANEMYKWYKGLNEEYSRLNSQLNLRYRDYMRGRMMMGQDDDFYPDANLTLRVAYGKVQGYSPADGIYYKPYSTIAGVIEKDNPDIFDYDIPQALRDLFAKGKAPDTPVCFLATNHTTGGNSGSPVINAEGELVGINFDRVWEGTMSDIVYDPDYCRNISVDIRYILFVIDKLGGAGHLMNELVFAD